LSGRRKYSASKTRQLQFFRAAAPCLFPENNERASIQRNAREIERVSALLAYWLVPAEPQRTFFSRLIESLATQNDAAPFEPHVTIYASLTNGADQPQRIIEETVHAIAGPIALRVERVGLSEKFTKTLFVEFAASPQLSALSKALQQLSSAPREYELKPHLSLIYKHLNDVEKRALAQRTSIPFSVVVFDEIKAITGPVRTKTRADVEAWRVVYSRNLFVK